MSAVPTPLPMRAMDTIAMPAQSTAVQPEDFQRGLIAGDHERVVRGPHGATGALAAHGAMPPNRQASIRST